MKKKIFVDNSLESAFNEKGYVTLDLLSPDQLEILFSLLNEIKEVDKREVVIKSDYELSFFNKDVAYKKMVLDKIYRFFKPHLDKVLDDYEPLIINLFNKKPNSGEVPVHQNWTFVDEEKFTSVSVWIPLCDVTRENGTMEVVPNTHNTLTRYRSPSIPWVFKGLENKIKKKYMHPINLKLGQVAIIDDALLHYTSENNTAKDRETIQLIMKPKEAIPIHYYCENVKRKSLVVYKVDADFFMSFNMNERPKGVEAIGLKNFQYKKLNEREFKNRIT